jgi:hypothetical protein
VFWDAYVQWHDADVDAFAFVEAGGGVLFSYASLGRWSVGLGFRAAHVEFDEFDAGLGVEREDTTFSARTWAGMVLTSRIRLVPSLEFIASDSEAAFADYDRTLVSLDLVWDAW